MKATLSERLRYWFDNWMAKGLALLALHRVSADAHNSERGYGVRVNPKKTDKHSCAAGDKVIVLAAG